MYIQRNEKIYNELGAMTFYIIKLTLIITGINIHFNQTLGLLQL